MGTGSSPVFFTGSGLGGGADLAAVVSGGRDARGAELSTFFLVLRVLVEPLRSVGRADN